MTAIITYENSTLQEAETASADVWLQWCSNGITTASIVSTVWDNCGCVKLILRLLHVLLFDVVYESMELRKYADVHKLNSKLCGFSPEANYTDWVTTAFRRT
jgi:hypothetical protein